MYNFLTVVVSVLFLFSTNNIIERNTYSETENSSIVNAENDLTSNKIELKTSSCSDKPELCTCIAAGGCAFASASSCRIQYCDGEVETDSFNSKPDNITTITQLCEAEN